MKLVCFLSLSLSHHISHFVCFNDYHNIIGWIGKNPTKYKYVEVKKSSLELEKEHKARIQRLSKCSRLFIAPSILFSSLNILLNILYT